MNIKDVTSTSFGLIVAYLLPGLAGLYTISLYLPNARIFEQSFLLVLLAALLSGVFANGVRAVLHRYAEWKPLGVEHFSEIVDSDKLACVVAVVDEYYRAHQFFGSLALIIPVWSWHVLYCGASPPGVLSIKGFGVVALWLLSIRADIESWSSYVDIAQHILHPEVGELTAQHTVCKNLRRVVWWHFFWRDRRELLRNIEELRKTAGQIGFAGKYDEFKKLVTNHTTVLAPLLSRFDRMWQAS